MADQVEKLRVAQLERTAPRRGLQGWWRRRSAWGRAAARAGLPSTPEEGAKAGLDPRLTGKIAVFEASAVTFHPQR